MNRVLSGDEPAPMVLAAPDGMTVRLSIVGYQYPASTRDSLNWLMIKGEISHPSGAWAFLDPALETDEVELLCDWLERVAAAPDVGQSSAAFTEPNLAFEHRIDGASPSIVLRVAYESAPPWCSDQQARLVGVELAFPLATNDLTVCSARLRAQLARFPSREPIELASDQDSGALRALVLRCANLERTKEFYEHLGLCWTAERHGSGPLHYSTQLGPTLLEIYPSTPSWPATRVRLALGVAELASGLERLTVADLLAQPARRVAHDDGSIAVIVHDPEDNVVELSERSQ
jgi:lactoylglutathione lyase